ncbi:MAG TPA: hypothetical protein VM802_07510, partial [Chitinophaga sp.]|uniref:immunoglobulin domain-containing protein n=1 Tax=Chitinophaga sp. TaxID=1869181 RepID=UPI002CE35A9F
MKPQFYMLRKAAVCLFMLLCLLVRQANAQVYANTENNGVSGTGICIGCGVLNSGNAVNPNLTDYSTFSITAGLLDVAVYQTLIFPAASTTGCDSLIIRIGSSNAVLSAAILGGVTVQTFNGSTPNNDAQAVSTSILRILQGNQDGEILLKPAQTFDRVKVTLTSSLVGLLSSFRIYFALRKPSVATPNGTDSITICGGQSTIVTATAAPGSTIRWYNASTGGTLLATGGSYTVTPTVTTTYYAEAAAGTCKSVRKPVKVIVNPKPVNPAYSVPQGLTCGSFGIP